MSKPKPSFLEITKRIGSDDRSVRAEAVRDLLLVAKKDPALQVAALKTLRGALRTETDSIIPVDFAWLHLMRPRDENVFCYHRGLNHHVVAANIIESFRARGNSAADGLSLGGMRSPVGDFILIHFQ